MTGTALPLKVFVHIPKTAGSSICRALTRWSRKGTEHCQAVIGDTTALTGLAAGNDWIAGHVERPRMHTALRAVTDRPLEFYTLLRDPARQVASHYNWLIEIHRRGGDFYANHPPDIQRLSERIRAADNTDPAAIAEILGSRPRLFLNLQTRFVLPQPKTDETAAARIDRGCVFFDMICTEARMRPLLERMTGRLPWRLKPVNTSRYHFDRRVFDKPELRAFLAAHNHLDAALYAEIRRREAAD